MTNEIAKVFSSERFGNVRVVVLSDGPWFVGKDIAETLGYKNTNKAVMEHVDDEDKFMRSTRGNEMGKLFSSLKEIQEIFGRQDNWFISESGIYSMIFGSTLPVAREFKRWITHEVLPSIRKTGSYGKPALPQTYQEALRELADKCDVIEQQKFELTAAKPKVDFYDQVRESEQTLSMNDAAKLLGIKGLGRNKLFEQLRSRGVLDDTNVPYQRFLNSGHFEVIEKPYEYNGMVGITKVTRVTQKGLQWMSKEFSLANR